MTILVLALAVACGGAPKAQAVRAWQPSRDTVRYDSADVYRRGYDDATQAQLSVHKWAWQVRPPVGDCYKLVGPHWVPCYGVDSSYARGYAAGRATCAKGVAGSIPARSPRTGERSRVRSPRLAGGPAHGAAGPARQRPVVTSAQGIAFDSVAFRKRWNAARPGDGGPEHWRYVRMEHPRPSCWKRVALGVGAGLVVGALLRDRDDVRVTVLPCVPQCPKPPKKPRGCK